MRKFTRVKDHIIRFCTKVGASEQFFTCGGGGRVGRGYNREQALRQWLLLTYKTGREGGAMRSGAKRPSLRRRRVVNGGPRVSPLKNFVKLCLKIFCCFLVHSKIVIFTTEICG